MAIHNDDFEENLDNLFGMPDGTSDISNAIWNSNQGQMQYGTQGTMEYNTQSQMPFGTQQQTGYQDNYEQYYQNQQYQQYQQQGYIQQQEEVEKKPTKSQEFFGKLLDSGFQLNHTTMGILIGIVGLIVVLIVGGLFNLGNKPKTQKVVKQVPKTVTTTVTNTNTEQGNKDIVKMTIVGDEVSIDYSVAILESTGLITAKNKYLLNGQLVYSLSISITVGNEQKQLEHFCNYNLFKSITTGEVVNVKYQQLTDSVLTVCDIMK